MSIHPRGGCHVLAWPSTRPSTCLPIGLPSRPASTRPFVFPSTSPAIAHRSIPESVHLHPSIHATTRPPSTHHPSIYLSVLEPSPLRPPVTVGSPAGPPVPRALVGHPAIRRPSTVPACGGERSRFSRGDGNSGRGGRSRPARHRTSPASPYDPTVPGNRQASRLRKPATHLDAERRSTKAV